MEYKVIRSDDYLAHYGVPGMKWGVRKQRYYEKKYGKRLKKSEKYDKKILSRREKNLQRINKKISKLEYRRDDFNEGTKLIKAGMDTYNSIIKNRMNTKIKALNDSSYKKTFAYKNAGLNYVRQLMINSTYGQGYTKLRYSSDIANKKDPKI